MILALAYSAGPAMLLGIKKKPLAKKLNNQILHTDADAQKADYMTAFAAMLGILGIGVGLWWADAVAALFISTSILKDGIVNLKDATQNLMDRCPTKIDSEEHVPLVQEVVDLVESWDWVECATIRLRESGQVYIGEVLVKPNREAGLVEKIEAGMEALREADWKLQDVVIVPVNALPDDYRS